MTTEKLVNKSLFGKTELASQKIQLGVLQDLQENINKGVSLGESTKQQLSIVDNQAKLKKDLETKLEIANIELNKQIVILDNKAQDTKAYYNKAEQLYTVFINKSSDLGIDYPKSIDANFKILEKQVEFINNSIPKIKSK